MMERQRVSAGLCFGMALAIVLAGILGPLVLGVIEFRLTDMLVNQYLGGEVVTLFIAAPALIIAGILWLRSNRLAPVLAFGPALYTVYTFVSAIVGQEYLLYGGNAEKAFPLYTLLIATGFAVAGLSGWQIMHTTAPPLPARLRMVTSGLFLAVVAFFALSWGSQIAGIYRGDPPTEYLEGPTLFWLIKLMDLGFLLPVFAVVGFGVLRRHAMATRGAYGLVGYAACMAGAVLGMAIAMWLRDDPSASGAMIAFLVPVAAGFFALAGRLMALYRQGRSHTRHASTIGPIPPLGHGHA